jgi:hypothetical protein
MSSGTSTEASQAFRPWELFTLAALIGGIVVVLLGRGAPRVETIFLGFTVFAAGALGVAVWRSFAPLADALEFVSARVRGGRSRAALEREKGLVLRSIKELEFDRSMKKISEQDFAEMSERLRVRAARLMQQLDEGVAYRDAIAKALEARVPREAMTAAPVATACGGCGVANDPDARFCKGCGARLEAAS